MGMRELLRSRYDALYVWLAASGHFPTALPYPRELNQTAAEACSKYLDLLTHWTKRIDLVAPASNEVLLERHLVDSWAAGMLFAAYSPLDPSLPYLDLGSGAGLPGLVLAILEPSRPLLLVEPREKRAVFLREAAQVLGLENVEVFCCRAEELDLRNRAIGLLTARALGRSELLFKLAEDSATEISVVAELLGPKWSEGEAKEVFGSLRGVPELLHLVKYQLSEGGPERQIPFWRVGGSS